MYCIYKEKNRASDCTILPFQPSDWLRVENKVPNGTNCPSSYGVCVCSRSPCFLNTHRKNANQIVGCTHIHIHTHTPNFSIQNAVRLGPPPQTHTIYIVHFVYVCCAFYLSSFYFYGIIICCTFNRPHIIAHMHYYGHRVFYFHFNGL